MRKFAQLRTQERLKKLDAKLQLAAEDPENEKAIHDLRVAIRRGTQCLRTFAQFFDADRIKPLRRRLRKVMDRCAAARNCDIALKVLRAAGVHDPEIAEELTKLRRRAKKELARKLQAGRKLAQVHLHASEDQAGIWDLSQSVAENARRVLPALAGELFAAGDAAAVAGSGYRKLHKFRLEVKRFRYTFELFQPIYPATTTSGMSMLGVLQDKLGAISDCGATLEMVKKHRRAAAAVRKLLARREARFREHWANHYGSKTREWWATTLSGSGDLVA